MTRPTFPDAPISESEWRKRRAVESIHGDLSKEPFWDDLASVADFMQTRESCDLCDEAQLDYDDERIIVIELTGEADNVWTVLCPECFSDNVDRYASEMTLIYRVFPVHSLIPGVTLLHNGMAVPA